MPGTEARDGRTTLGSNGYSVVAPLRRLPDPPFRFERDGLVIGPSGDVVSVSPTPEPRSAAFEEAPDSSFSALYQSTSGEPSGLPRCSHNS